jgi:hypothetical protein
MTINPNAITMKEARYMIGAAYRKNKPLMLLGSPGMGKSALFESVARELGGGFIDFRLTMKDPVDVGGMRIPDVATGRMKHYAPEDLPTNKKAHGEKGLIVFDEINAVSLMMQAAPYGIIQERRIGQIPLLPGWVPMASGNNVGDRASAQRISTALANRFNVQIVEPDIESWLEQYATANVDHRGCAFLRFRPKLLHVMPTADQIAFPSPRSWTNAFAFIDETPTMRRKIFTGYVGEAAANEFEAFWRIMERAVTPDQIINDPKKAAVPDAGDAGLAFAVSGMVSRIMDRKNVAKVAQYVTRLMPDYQVCIWRDATSRDESLKNTSEYGAFAVAHADLLT